MPVRSRPPLTVASVSSSALVRPWRYVMSSNLFFLPQVGAKLIYENRSVRATRPLTLSPGNSTLLPRSSPRSSGLRLSSPTSPSGKLLLHPHIPPPSCLCLVYRHGANRPSSPGLSEPARLLPLSRLRRFTLPSASGSVRPSLPRLPTPPG